MNEKVRALETELARIDENSFLPSKISEIDSIAGLERVISELEDEEFVVSSAEQKNAYWAMPLIVLYILLIIRGNSKVEDAISSRQRVDEIKEKQLSVREKIFALKVRDEFRDTPIQNYMIELWNFAKSNRSRSDHSINRDNLLIAYPMLQEYLSLYYNKVPQTLSWKDFDSIYNDFKTFLKTNFPEVYRSGIEMKEVDRQEKELQKQSEAHKNEAEKTELRNQTIIEMKEYFQDNSILSEIDVVTKMRRDENYEFIDQSFPFINILYTNGLLSKADKYHKSITYYYIEFLKQNFEDIIYEAKSTLLLEHECKVQCDEDVQCLMKRIWSKFSFYEKRIAAGQIIPLGRFDDEELFIKYFEAHYPGTRTVSKYQVNQYEDYLNNLQEYRKKYKLLESK